jgi:hypothetical protein
MAIPLGYEILVRRGWCGREQHEDYGSANGVRAGGQSDKLPANGSVGGRSRGLTEIGKRLIDDYL